MRIAPVKILAFVAIAGLVAAVMAFYGDASAGGADEAAAAATEATFYGDVLPILQERCQKCHRPGEVAPMPLLTYGDAFRFSRMMKEVVSERRMPPWSAEPGIGVKFHNDRALSKAEIDTIVSWVDAGGPRGEETAVEAPPDYVEGWNIEPDMVVKAPEFAVPADGTVEYTYYIVPQAFEEDSWVKITELRPTNREVTHHLIVYVRPPGSSYFRDYPEGEYFVPEPGDRGPEEGESGFRWRQGLGGYAPGTNPYEANFPEDQAVFVEAGSQMVFEVHYTTNGTATTDTPTFGIDFYDGEPATRRLGGAVINQRFEIPPGEADHKVEAATKIMQDVVLQGMTPHMHLRGKSFEYRAVFPDGRTEVLLRVPKWDFRWQTTYFLEEPMLLPAGTIIEGTAYFDNSAGNADNPDPGSPVKWGDQSWEEMMIGFFSVSVDPGVNPERVFGRPDR